MPIDYSQLPLSKGTPRKRIKARKQRAETAVKQRVRAECVERDGDCVLRPASWHVCGGESQWSHLGKKKRARTRGMPPEVRHTTAGSLMLCTVAHLDYDEWRMQIDELTADGADGPLRFTQGESYYVSPGSRAERIPTP